MAAQSIWDHIKQGSVLFHGEMYEGALNNTSKGGLTPLMFAAQTTHYFFLTSMLSWATKEQVEARDHKGLTVLHRAALSGKLNNFKAVAHALIQKKGDTNPQNNQGVSLKVELAAQGASNDVFLKMLDVLVQMEPRVRDDFKNQGSQHPKDKDDKKAKSPDSQPRKEELGSPTRSLTERNSLGKTWLMHVASSLTFVSEIPFAQKEHVTATNPKEKNFSLLHYIVNGTNDLNWRCKNLQLLLNKFEEFGITDISPKDSEGRTPLDLIPQAQEFDQMRYLLIQWRPNLKREENKATVKKLVWQCAAGYSDISKDFTHLDLIPDIKERTHGNQTPLMVAMKVNTPYLPVLLRACDKEAFEMQDSEGSTALHIAVKKRLPQARTILEFMTSLKANINILDKWGKTPLDYLKEIAPDHEYVKVFIERGAKTSAEVRAKGGSPSPEKVDHKEKSSKAAVWQCAESHDLDKIQQMMRMSDMFLHIKERNSEGLSPLMVAIKSNSPSVALFMPVCDKQALEMQDLEGSTALHLIIKRLNTEQFQIILQRMLILDANINIMDKHGKTPLDYLKSMFIPQIVEAFIIAGGKTGAFVKAQGSSLSPKKVLNKDPSKPLVWQCAECQDLSEVHEMIMAEEMSLDLKKRNEKGLTPLMVAIACNSRSYSFFAAISDKEVFEMHDPEGLTSLHQAIKYKRNDQILVIAVSMKKQGANINIFDKQGKTPLDYVKELMPIPQLIETLTKIGAMTGAEVKASMLKASQSSTAQKV